MKEKVNVAVVGATGVVGETIIQILEERDFPVEKLIPLASERSIGKKVEFRGKHIDCELLNDFDFSQADIALFSAGGGISAEYAPKAGAAGCIVVDNTSHFRNEPDVPLVVPEVNGQAIKDYPPRNIIANPNCSTIQMLVALKPIYDAVGITRINVATYQAVSGAGRNYVETLASQTANLMSSLDADPEDESKRIAFNAIPHIDDFQENGYTREEMKMVWETRKIFEDENIQVNPTCVRVPVFFGHSEAVHLETKDKISAEEVRVLLEAAPGIDVMDGRELGGYPTPAQESAGADSVFVGRIREDISHPRGISLWVVADNVRKGAALNSVQIAEILVQEYL
jgi:aspartate-semialdehyde dehydrogenase